MKLETQQVAVLPSEATPRSKTSISVVLAAYNEAAILEKNVNTLVAYLSGLEQKYRWELIIVNDGSADETGKIADWVAAGKSNIRVVHHPANMGLCEALKTGFQHCRGRYAITLDIDLSYSPDHIERLLTEIENTKSHVVIASAYMEGGTSENVPWFRLAMSKWSNRFLSKLSPGRICTFTGMVRAYDLDFIQNLNLKAKG